MRNRSILRLTSFCMVFLISGCTTIPSGSSQDSAKKELTFGYVQVETNGVNPRGYSTNVRFISLTNTETGERFRMNINSDSDVFSLRLAHGNYSVDRVQFNEGPFLAESHVKFEFHVSPGKATYLGVWQFKVDAPRTVRQVHINLEEGDPEISRKFSENLVLEQVPIDTVVPQPNSLVARVYSVAPNPKFRYFYRR